MKRFWCRVRVSDISMFEYSGPWWVSGYMGFETELTIVCCAVVAKDEADAKQQVRACFDTLHALDGLDFVDEKPAGWSPFSGRFPFQHWMRWPVPAADLLKFRGVA